MAAPLRPPPLPWDLSAKVSPCCQLPATWTSSFASQLARLGGTVPRCGEGEDGGQKPAPFLALLVLSDPSASIQGTQPMEGAPPSPLSATSL